MTWDAKFWRPIVLLDRRSIATLGEARSLILALPESQRIAEHWQDAGQLLALASGSNSAIDDALLQMIRALKIDGMI
jgi:hypothetical protein